MVLELLGDRFDRRNRTEHTALNGRHVEIFEHRSELGANHRGGHGEDVAYAASVLRGDARDGTGAMQPIRREDFQVRLEPCATARIGARNRKDTSQVVLPSSGAGARATPGRDPSTRVCQLGTEAVARLSPSLRRHYPDQVPRVFSQASANGRATPNDALILRPTANAQQGQGCTGAPLVRGTA